MKPISRDSLIMLGVTVAMVVAAVMIVYLPQGRKLDQLHAQATTQQLALESEAQKVAVVPEMIRQVQSLESRYGDFGRRLPKQQELHEFLRQVNSSLAESELTDLSIEPDNPTKEEFFHTLPIIMKFRSNYLTLANFLSSMEKMERLSRIHRLVIRNDEKGQNLNVELQMSIFFTES